MTVFRSVILSDRALASESLHLMNVNIERIRRGALLTAVLLFTWQNATARDPQVFAGPHSYTSFLIDGAGGLSGWGETGFGQLGIGLSSDQTSPVTIPFPFGVQGWRTVASGVDNGGWSFGIADDGQLYVAGAAWGFAYASYFTLVPAPQGASGWSALAVSDLGWLAIASNGSIYGNINGGISWAPRPGATRWTQVAIGSWYYRAQGERNLFALDSAGRIYGVYSGTAAFSNPGFVEIARPAGATAWTNIVAGLNFTLAQANDGNLYGWGHNEVGQLGLGFGFAVTNTPQRISLPSGKTGWNTIAAGSRHALATTTDGQLFAWGHNGYGQLGLGNNQSQFSPTAVPTMTNVAAIAGGFTHSLAIADCTAFAWGENTVGQLGAGFFSPYYPLPLQKPFAYDFCSTNPPQSPLVSISALDAIAAESTWLPNFTNAAQLEVSRSVATASSLQVQLAIGGTAVNGVDYQNIPTTITIPAYSNSVSILIIPTGSILATNPAVISVALVSGPGYQFGGSSNVNVTLFQYQSESDFHGPGPGLPTLKWDIFVGTNSNGQVFTVESSTNLVDWVTIGTATNVFGVVTVNETNRLRYRHRFFRVVPSSL